MRRIVHLATLMVATVILHACGSDSPVQPESVASFQLADEVVQSGLPAAAIDCESCVLASAQLVVSRGPAEEHTVAFPSISGEEAVLLAIGAVAALNASEVRLNGTRVRLRPRPDGSAAVPLVLSESNELAITPRGQPGSTLEVQIVGGATIVGPHGGLIEDSEAGAALSIPAGALGTETVIVMESVPHLDHDPEFVDFAAPRISLLPSGLDFLTPATLTFALPEGSFEPAEPPTAVAVLEDHGYLLWLESEPDASTSTVSIQLNGFSSYTLVTPYFFKLQPNRFYTVGLEDCPPRLKPTNTPCETYEWDLRDVVRDWATITGSAGISLGPRYQVGPNTDIAVRYFDWFLYGFVRYSKEEGVALLDVFNRQRIVGLNGSKEWSSRAGTWLHDPFQTWNGVSFMRVLSHELGHHFGLGHEDAIGAVMSRSWNYPVSVACEEEAIFRSRYSIAGGADRCLNQLDLGIWRNNQFLPLPSVVYEGDRLTVTPWFTRAISPLQTENFFVWARSLTGGVYIHPSSTSQWELIFETPGTHQVEFRQPGLGSTSAITRTFTVLPANPSGPENFRFVGGNLSDGYTFRWDNPPGALQYEFFGFTCGWYNTRCVQGGGRSGPIRSEVTESEGSLNYVGSDRVELSVRVRYPDGTPSRWAPFIPNPR